MKVNSVAEDYAGQWEAIEEAARRQQQQQQNNQNIPASSDLPATEISRTNLLSIEAAKELQLIDRAPHQKSDLADKQVKYQMVAGETPDENTPVKKEEKKTAPATKEQVDVLEEFAKGNKTAEQVVEAFGGRTKIAEYMKSDAPVPDHLKTKVVDAAYQVDLKNYGRTSEANRKQMLADLERSGKEQQEFNRSLSGKDDFARFKAAEDAAKRTDLLPQTREYITDYGRRLKENLTDDKLRDFSKLPANEAVEKSLEFAEKLNLTAEEKQQFADRLAQRTSTQDLTRANELQGQYAIRSLAEINEDKFSNPGELVLQSFDKAAELSNKGYGEGAAQLLENQARVARERLQITASESPNATLLRNFADTADAQAKALRAVTPKQGYEAAQELYRKASQADRAAEALEKDENFEQAKLLRTMSRGAAVQAAQTNAAASNTNVMFGKAIADSYRQVVNASFDEKIKEARTWAYPWQDKSPADILKDQKQKMNVVFDELNRTMQEKGVSFDRAWSDMNDDAQIDGWNKEPRRVPGFPTREDAAKYLRDNEVTRGLVSPFADLARGFSEGSDRTIDKASGDIIKVLKANGQWNIAEALTKDFQKNARSADGKKEADDLAGRQTWDWLKAKTGEFILDEMPTMVLAGVISGGAGWGVKALTTAAKWGPRAIKTATAVTEFGTFLGSQKVLDEALRGKNSHLDDPKAWARDAAFQAAFLLGGKALGKAFGKSWEFLRVNNFGVPSGFQTLRGKLAGMNKGEQELLGLLNTAKGGVHKHKGEIGIETLAKLTQVTKSEIALLRNPKTGESMLYKGTKSEIPQLTEKEAERLAKEGWELQAHSHLRDLNPSRGDGRMVEKFGQQTSVIVNQRGKWREFIPEEAFGGKVGNLSNGAAASSAAKTAANAADLNKGKWLGKPVKENDPLPDGYYWREGDIYRKAGNVEKNYAPLQFDKTTGKIVLREGVERISVPSVMRRNFDAQLTNQFRKELAATGLTGGKLEKAVEKAVEKEMARTQIHHLVPDEIVQKTELGKLARDAGYNLDRSENLLGLARSAADKKLTGEVGHWTSHPKYSREVEAEMTRTHNALKAKHGANPIPKQEILDEMKRIESLFRKKINDGKVPQVDGRLARLNWIGQNFA